MDRLVDGVEPIQRISQSKSRLWTSYCHPKIWDVYCKEAEEAIRNEFNRLLRGMDVFALAMIVLRVGTKLDLSYLYIFNGLFNRQLLRGAIDQFCRDRQQEDAALCECLKSILLEESVSSFDSPQNYRQALLSNPHLNRDQEMDQVPGQKTSGN